METAQPRIDMNPFYPIVFGKYDIISQSILSIENA